MKMITKKYKKQILTDKQFNTAIANLAEDLFGMFFSLTEYQKN